VLARRRDDHRAIVGQVLRDDVGRIDLTVRLEADVPARQHGVGDVDVTQRRYDLRFVDRAGLRHRDVERARRLIGSAEYHSALSFGYAFAHLASNARTASFGMS